MRPTDSAIRVLYVGRKEDLRLIHDLAKTLTGLTLVTCASTDVGRGHLWDERMDILMVDIDTPVKELSMLDLLSFIRRGYKGLMILIGADRQARELYVAGTNWHHCEREDRGKQLIEAFHELHAPTT